MCKYKLLPGNPSADKIKYLINSLHGEIFRKLIKLMEHSTDLCARPLRLTSATDLDHNLCPQPLPPTSLPDLLFCPISASDLCARPLPRLLRPTSAPDLCYNNILLNSSANFCSNDAQPDIWKTTTELMKTWPCKYCGLADFLDQTTDYPIDAIILFRHLQPPSVTYLSSFDFPYVDMNPYRSSHADITLAWIFFVAFVALMAKLCQPDIRITVRGELNAATRNDHRHVFRQTRPNDGFSLSLKTVLFLTRWQTDRFSAATTALGET